MNRLPKNRCARLTLLIMIFNAGPCFGSIRTRHLCRDSAGWAPNSCDKFACNLSEDLMTSVADAMASNGIEEAGYKYVVIDVAGRSDRTKALSFATPRALPRSPRIRL
jgi:hypothetical protein